jgi:hypothetical protein
MTTKPKTRKAPATDGAELDPIFAAIAEHKALIKESNRLERSYRVARDKAEKKHGEWISAPKPCERAGKATVRPFYDQWCRAIDAERKVAIRMARTIPLTTAGIEAMIHHAHQAIVTHDLREVDWRDWVPTMLKTVSRSLVGAA